MDSLIYFLKALPMIGNLFVVLLIIIIIFLSQLFIFMWMAGFMARRNAEEIRKVLLEFYDDQTEDTETEE